MVQVWMWWEVEEEVVLEKEFAYVIEDTCDGHNEEKVAKLGPGHGAAGGVGNGICAFEGEEGVLKHIVEEGVDMLRRAEFTPELWAGEVGDHGGHNVRRKA